MILQLFYAMSLPVSLNFEQISYYYNLCLLNDGSSYLTDIYT